MLTRTALAIVMDEVEAEIDAATEDNLPVDNEDMHVDFDIEELDNMLADIDIFDEQDQERAA